VLYGEKEENEIFGVRILDINCWAGKNFLGETVQCSNCKIKEIVILVRKKCTYSSYLSIFDKLTNSLKAINQS